MVETNFVSLRSVKDRIALNMINRAEQEGLISPGKTTLVRRCAYSCLSNKCCQLRPCARATSCLGL